MEPTQSFNRPITTTSSPTEPVALEDVVIADDTRQDVELSSPSQDITEAGNVHGFLKKNDQKQHVA